MSSFAQHPFESPLVQRMFLSAEKINAFEGRFLDLQLFEDFCNFLSIFAEISQKSAEKIQ